MNDDAQQYNIIQYNEFAMQTDFVPSWSLAANDVRVAVSRDDTSSTSATCFSIVPLDLIDDVDGW